MVAVSSFVVTIVILVDILDLTAIMTTTVLEGSSTVDTTDTITMPAAGANCVAVIAIMATIVKVILVKVALTILSLR